MKLEHCHRASCVQIIDALSDHVSRATNNALYWHNRCLELEEIIELFCMDAEVNQFWPDWDITKVLHERIAELEQELQTTADALGHALLKRQP